MSASPKRRKVWSRRQLRDSAGSTSWSTMWAAAGVGRASLTAPMRTGVPPWSESDPDRADDATGPAAYEGSFGRFRDQRGIDFGLVGTACDVRPVRRGQGSVDLRYRALGARIR